MQTRGNFPDTASDSKLFKLGQISAGSHLKGRFDDLQEFEMVYKKITQKSFGIVYLMGPKHREKEYVPLFVGTRGDARLNFFQHLRAHVKARQAQGEKQLNGLSPMLVMTVNKGHAKPLTNKFWMELIESDTSCRQKLET